MDVLLTHTRFFLIISACITPVCYAPVLTITESGIYELGDNIQFAPGAGPDSIILIQASNVTLDLGGRVIEQTDSTADINGITIADTASNIIIRNDTILNVTDRGISITAASVDSTNITLTNITLIGCQNRGISLDTTIGTTTSNITITQCSLIDCLFGASGDTALHLAGSNLTLRNCAISFTPGSGSLPAGTRTMINCALSDSLIENVQIQGGTSSSTLIGLRNAATSSGTTTTIFRNIVIQQLNAQTASCTGISCVGATQCFFIGCSTVGLNGSTVIGFQGDSTTQENIFVGCSSVSASSTTGCTGFSFTNSTDLIFTDCISDRLTASSAAAPADGFFFTTTTRCHLVRCMAANNSAIGAGSRANGFRFQQCTNCSSTESIAATNAGVSTGSGFFISSNCVDCSFNRNNAYRNGSGSTIACGFETEAAGTGTNAFSGNLATRNGNVDTNQFRFFANQTRTLRTVINTNPNTSPWTNVALT